MSDEHLSRTCDRSSHEILVQDVFVFTLPKWYPYRRDFGGAVVCHVAFLFLYVMGRVVSTS